MAKNSSDFQLEKGRLVASLLTGVWRSPESIVDVSESMLGELTPLLLKKGAGALAWWRIRHSSLRDSPPARELHDAYRFHTLQNALREKELVETFQYLRSKGLDPLVVKGWAAARLYPERGLRPYGDLDLCVAPDQYEMARAVLRSPQAPRCPVELHEEFRELKDRSPEEIFERSVLTELRGEPIRILSTEDHLRLLCLHALHHGLWRPLWLCDAAVMLDSLPADFSWESCLQGDRWYTDGVRCALKLAAELLDASVEKIPVEWREEKPLPRWFLPAALSEWGRSQHHMLEEGMDEVLGQPGKMLRALRLRWPNPIRATFTVGAPFNDLPRLPFQVCECFLRAARFARKMARSR